MQELQNNPDCTAITFYLTRTSWRKVVRMKLVLDFFLVMLTSDFPTKKMSFFRSLIQKWVPKEYQWNLHISCLNFLSVFFYRVFLFRRRCRNGSPAVSCPPRFTPAVMALLIQFMGNNYTFPQIKPSFPAYNQILTTRLVLIAQTLKSVFTCLFKISLWIFVLRPEHD